MTTQRLHSYQFTLVDKAVLSSAPEEGGRDHVIATIN